MVVSSQTIGDWLGSAECAASVGPVHPAVAVYDVSGAPHEKLSLLARLLFGAAWLVPMLLLWALGYLLYRQLLVRMDNVSTAGADG